jgi:hypothetical protein
MHRDERVQRRVRDAVKREEAAGVKHRLVTVESLRRLAEEVEAHGSLCVAIVELHSRLLPALQDLAGRFPCLPIVVYTSASLPGDDLRRVFAMGLSQVLLFDVDDQALRIGESITHAALELPTARLTELVSSELGDDAARVVTRAFEVASGSRPLATLSRARRTGRRSLERDMKCSRLAPPASLVRHCRILLASVLLADPRRSFASVSTALGYSGERTLSRQLQMLGVRRRDLVGPGGLDRVIERVLENIIRPSANGLHGDGRHD